MSDERIDLHPEIQQVLDENMLLGEELAEGLAELHGLQHIVKPHLLALYQTKLGPWELRLLEARCFHARLKRKAELVQASLNRGQMPDLTAIDGALETEFIAWQARVKEAASMIEAAQFRLGHLLSANDGAELRKLYYALVKKLHPDVNPHLSNEQRDLWLHVVAAYETSDLNKLKALSLLVDGHERPAAESGIEALRAENGRLRTQTMQLFRRLAEIAKQPPFSLRDQWEDDAWVAHRREELDALISAAQERAHALEIHLQTLLAAHGSRQQFGLN